MCTAVVGYNPLYTDSKPLQAVVKPECRRKRRSQVALVVAADHGVAEIRLKRG